MRNFNTSNFWMIGMAMIWLVLSPIGCATATRSELKDTRYNLVDVANPRAKLVLGSRDLLGQVVIIEPKFRLTGKLTEASVSVQSIAKQNLNLEYRFEWSDDDGFPVDGFSVWRPFVLTPNMIKPLRATGPNPMATRITFTVRFPHTSS